MKVCDILESALSGAVSYFESFDFLNTINIYRIEDESVWLDPTGKFKLFGVRLETTSNREVGFAEFDNLIKEIRYSSDGEIFLVIVSKSLHKAVYLFAYSQNILNSIKSSYGTRLMKGREVCDALYDSYFALEYKINNENKKIFVESTNSFVPAHIENARGRFKSVAQMSITNNLQSGKVYQGVSYSGKEKMSIVELLSIGWDGVATIRFDFKASSAISTIKKYQEIARIGDKNFAKICDSVINETDTELCGEINSFACVMNSMLYLKNESIEKLAAISNETGIMFVENPLTGKKVYSKSLLQTRDHDFDALVHINTAKKFFQTSIKKNVPENMFSYFWGVDICGNFFNYNLREASSSPHMIVIGRNGSGKSRQVIKMMEQVLGLNIQKGTIDRLGKIKVRYGDVGFTSGRMLEAINKISPAQVMASEANIDNLRFSLFDLNVDELGRVKAEDMDYAVGIVNFAIQTKGGDVLNGIEEDFFRKIITRMIVDNVYTDYPLSKFIDKGGYGALLEELFAQGYNKDTQISELDSKYDFLKKPTLSEVISRVGTEKNLTEYTKDEVDSLSSLGVKLRSLSSYYFLEFHSNSLESIDYDFFHIDFDSLKETPASFCVIYWLIMKKWIKMLKSSAKKRLAQHLEPIDTFFIIEEAHNFFAYPIFAQMLKTASKELRKYGGKLIFITQQLEDIPDDVAKEIGTKIFVAPPSEKAMLKSDIKKVFKHLDERDERVLDATTDYMMFLMYDGGSAGCKFVYEGDVEWFYKPYAISF